MSISLSELQDYTPQQPLDNGMYDLRVAEGCQVIEKTVPEGGVKHSLAVQAEVIGGNTQQDGSDPEGRLVSFFVQLDRFDAISSQRGRQFMMDNASEFFTAVGVDLSQGDFEVEEIVGADFRATNKLREYEGKMQENWSNFRPI